MRDDRGLAGADLMAPIAAPETGWSSRLLVPADDPGNPGSLAMPHRVPDAATGVTEADPEARTGIGPGEM